MKIIKNFLDYFKDHKPLVYKDDGYLFDVELSKNHPLGIASHSEDGWIYFEQKEWAPGIWAGTEGLTIMIRRNNFTICTRITAVDLEGRRIKIKIPHKVIKGDQIWPA